MNRLAGKVALITGAASGIGEGIARAFASEGGLVFVSDLRDELGESVADSLGPPARYVHLDVRDEKQWLAVVNSIRKDHGRLDVVVNNAGVTGFEGASGPHDPGESLSCGLACRSCDKPRWYVPRLQTCDKSHALSRRGLDH